MHGRSILSLLAAVFIAAGCSRTQSNDPLGFSVNAEALPTETITLMVDGQPVRIIRDRYGVPHILAQTNRGLFVAYGYAMGQDRLWQLETHRRAGLGTLAEILGSAYLPADQVTRIEGYSTDELDAMFGNLTSEERTIFEAYVEGINRYITEVIMPDPDNQLPLEFQAFMIGIPRPYSTRDLVGFLVYLGRRFGEIGGRETRNLSVLSSLTARYGETDGYAIFNDLRWLNDPDSPVSVPVTAEGGVGTLSNSFRLSEQLRGANNNSYDELRDKAFEIWRSLGIPTKLGSYAWAISPSRSATGRAMLYGGPQMGFSTPEVVHNVELIGGNGFRVVGMGVAGGPGVIIGHNQFVAWSLTTQAAGDNLDIYRETLCDAGGGEGSGYLYNGDCIRFDSRVEVIPVRGQQPVELLVERSVHGPVVSGRQGGFVYTQKRAHWLRELETISKIANLDRANNLNEFRNLVSEVALSFNVMYADYLGNIGYFVAGVNPVRAPGFDIRLPFPGDGSAEWTGDLRPNPFAINPVQGWLANWNNKPSVGYDNGDEAVLGKIFRVTEIQERLRDGIISVDTMKDIPKDIARVKGLGREARFLRPYLLDGLVAVPPSHRLAPAAEAVVAQWTGNAFADAIDSTHLEAGEVIFSRWVTEMISRTFAETLGAQLSEASSNTLLHVLDFALTGYSGVPPSRDYFNDQDPNAVISAAFDAVVAALSVRGEDPSQWATDQTDPRGTIQFTHPLAGLIASIPYSNRSTYGQVVVMSRPFIHGQNIFSLGQSGYIKVLPDFHFELDPHYRDLIPLYQNFDYKQMELFQPY